MIRRITGMQCRINVMILLFLFSGGKVLNGQTCENFRKEFDEEMTDYDYEFAEKRILPAKRSTLPSWFTGFHSGDTVMIAGISDPGLPDSVAVGQALTRARALSSMAAGTLCEYLSSSFSTGINPENYLKDEEFCRFSFDLKQNGVKILKKTILPSSEAIVVISVQPQGEIIDQGGSSRVIFYCQERDNKKLIKKIDVHITNSKTETVDSCSFYQLNGTTANIRCMFEDSRQYCNRYDFYYSDTGIPDSASLCYTSCRHGLWFAYLSQIMENLALAARNGAGYTKDLNETTQKGSSRILTNSSKLNIRWQLDNLAVKNNKLSISVKTSSIE